eukprot:9944132-Ditylum_brightwellii.AAC.1
MTPSNTNQDEERTRNSQHQHVFQNPNYAEGSSRDQSDSEGNKYPYSPLIADDAEEKQKRKYQSFQQANHHLHQRSVHRSEIDSKYAQQSGTNPSFSF